MKYRGKKVSILKSLDKQLEERAEIWFFKKYINVSEEKFENYKKMIIEEYLEEHPHIKEEYTNKKKFMKKLQIGLAVGAIAIGGLAYAKGMHQTEQPTEAIQTETTAYVPETQKVKTEYEIMQETVKQLKTDDQINNHRKQVIVEAYNKQNPENPITVDRLGVMKYTPEYLIEKTDKLGNTVEYQMKSTIDESKGEKLKQMAPGTEVYKFYIDNKAVAIYDEGMNKITDETIKQENTFFKDTVSLVYESERLKDVYKYQNDEDSKAKARENYTKEANSLLEYKSQNLEVKDLNKE